MREIWEHIKDVLVVAGIIIIAIILLKIAWFWVLFGLVGYAIYYTFFEKE